MIGLGIYPDFYPYDEAVKRADPVLTHRAGSNHHVETNGVNAMAKSHSIPRPNGTASKPITAPQTQRPMSELDAARLSAAQEKPLEEAAMDLFMARHMLEILHDLYALGDDVLKESVTQHMAGAIYSVLCRLRSAEKHVNRAPRRDAL